MRWEKRKKKELHVGNKPEPVIEDERFEARLQKGTRDKELPV